MRKVIILQARLASSRLPKKVLADLSGRPVIAHIVDRLKAAKLADEVCVAIPTGADEDELAEVLSGLPVVLVRGSGHDVLGRYIQAAYQTQAELIVRTTADNPLVSFAEIDRQLELLSGNQELDYVITEGYPLGITPETFTLKTLEKLDYLARHADMREHVTLYLRKRPGPFAATQLQAPPELARSEFTLTLDTAQDYDLMRGIYGKLYRQGELVSLEAVLELLDAEPELAKLCRLPVGIAASA
jgi:spore coat polysaccharide biosynthesis protein SpsF